MRVLHVAPVWLPVSAQAQGGIETFVAELVAAQQELGHEVTLVAAGGSDVPVRLVEAVPEGLVPVMQRGEADDYAYYEQELIVAAVDAARSVDVVHSHVVPGALALDGLLSGSPPVLHTLHGQVTQDLCWSLRSRPRAVVAVSDAQRAAASAHGATLDGTVHNGLDMRAVPHSATPGDGLLFLGRMEPQKGPDLAIATARALGLTLTLAGPVTDRDFYERGVRPQLGDGVEHVGVLGREAKHEALCRSACVLVPSRWAEPFGMVAIEAMATGTPVAALANGALPEVVDDGVTGRVVGSEADLAAAVREAMQLDRSVVRSTAWSRFHIATAAQRYVEHYTRLLERQDGS